MVSEVLYDKGLYRWRHEGTIAAKLVNIRLKISLETGTGLDSLEKIKESSAPRVQLLKKQVMLECEVGKTCGSEHI